MEVQTSSQDGRNGEADAIRRAQQGEAAAFEHLYRLHSRKVYALCLRMTENRADAEDLTQDAFLQLFRKIRTFRGDSAFSTWLYRLAVNRVLMSHRKNRISACANEEATEGDGEFGAISLEIGERDLRLAGVIDRLNLNRAIAQLPAGYRAVVILHDVKGYAHAEIARIMGGSIANSKSQLSRARRRLREILRRSLGRSRREYRSDAPADESHEVGSPTQASAALEPAQTMTCRPPSFAARMNLYNEDRSREEASFHSP